MVALLSGHALELGTPWLVLAPPPIWSVKSPYDPVRAWPKMAFLPPEVQAVCQSMRTVSAQWVQPSFGELFSRPAALNIGLKLNQVRPWNWRGRGFPPAFTEGTRDSVDASATGLLETIDGVSLLVHP